MNDINQQLRQIPQVEQLLTGERVSPFIDELGHPVVRHVIRKTLQQYRSRILEGEAFDQNTLIDEIIHECRTRKLEKLQRVINGTGVMIHTNLGRAPLGKNITDSLSQTLSGYCNLEFHLPSASRGKRGGFAEELICHLTGAEDALIVNNNASSVFLVLNQFGSGREVIVSRGELIQIGGGFRIPDIMEQTGARIVEVGTTNITTLDDFRMGLTDQTAMILSAHQSNFTMEGFAAMPSLSELATLANEDMLLYRDLGSGNLVENERLPRPFEVTVGQELKEGPHLVSFSGDKLLGGCQAGIIVGERNAIAALRKNPLMRMLRVDKITYYILQETLLQYANNSFDNVYLWNIILQDVKTIQRRVNRFLRSLAGHPVRTHITKIPLESTYGGGAMPAKTIPSSGIAIMPPVPSADSLYNHLLRGNPPVAGYIDNDRVIIDFRTIFDSDLPDLRKVLETIEEPVKK